ncbi:phosphoadenosine phosphosulfate reductase family protein [Deinococcus soli (ex Cha et al. 2016)]|uniref:phosphoadenosine phosphosulfate reductase domain-containing protein n=1 Tax=Deinococcus soli (ex Cha et al. 2016) TaxID=1309411 RepID=UPI001E636211|nr:phosphoadenosine phosphosulfate reductase family protein [Deinococcus soli (ex Cha et al. 2016)]
MTLPAALDLTADSLNLYGAEHDHWIVAFSGGKDSSATATAVSWLIKTGQVKAPKTLTALFTDTRMELPPLHASAMRLLDALKADGWDTHVVFPEMDKRFWVYMLGRGVPPPQNGNFRWCTRQMKLEAMQAVQAQILARYGRALLLTGVRVGESAARDQRIALSCSKDGAECGQGWFQQENDAPGLDKLAPLLHWRVCNVWDWLTGQEYGVQHGYPTQFVAESYGGDEAAEINARTGCVACPLASRDTALETVVQLPQWQHLTPLLRLRDMWREMREPQYRHRKRGERKKDGSLLSKGDRMGPLTLDARRLFLARVLAIQAQVQAGADRAGQPGMEMINPEELARIEHLISIGQMPDRWTGHEPRADEPYWPSHLTEAGQLPLLDGDL